VKKLIENGRRYRKLEAEYSRLVTEASLAALKKRQAKADPPAPAVFLLRLRPEAAIHPG